MNCDAALGDEIAALATQLEEGEYRLISKIGEFDAQGGYAHEGASSCAHWLSYGCTGVSAETSRRLACDAAVVEVVEDAAGRVLRTGRSISANAAAARSWR